MGTRLVVTISSKNKVNRPTKIRVIKRKIAKLPDSNTASKRNVYLHITDYTESVSRKCPIDLSLRNRTDIGTNDNCLFVSLLENTH